MGKEKRIHNSKQAKKNTSSGKGKSSRLFIAVVIAILAVLSVVAAVLLVRENQPDEYEKAFNEKNTALRNAFNESEKELPYFPAADAGNVVFLSVCNTLERATVITGKGDTIEAAWDNAAEQCRAFVSANQYDPTWLKVDIVTETTAADTDSLSKDLVGWNEFFRYGISFDDNFDCAFLEAELNGHKLINYDDKELDHEYINNYLRKAGRTQLSELPGSFYYFNCSGWFCDEDLTVYQLSDSGLTYGRREVEMIDKDYAYGLVTTAAEFLFDQINEDGSFIYGIYPRFDNDIDNYNFVRHASTLWSLVLQYRMTGDDSIIPAIDKCIDYMIENAIVFKDDRTAFLSEPKDGEIKLGGNGVAILALTEYMEVFGTDKYMMLAEQLANGILFMLDQATGEYVHILDLDYKLKEEFRTVYYDGEATFALCKLYALNGDKTLLDAAKRAVDHFIAADYTKHKDHWVEYAMNEFTKYYPTDEYYSFALKNIQINLDAVYERETTYHTYLELMMAGFEIYDRIIESGAEVSYLSEFDAQKMLDTIYCRADRMLNGYFYPEYSMYMANPQRVTNTFMVRHDGYRVRIDDVQHNIDGYYMYYKNFEKMVALGLTNH